MNPLSEAKAGSRPYISKALAAWLALGLGSLGVHRLYVYGWKDRWAWLHPWPTLAGLYGVQRMNELGQDDHLAWVLMPLLGLGSQARVKLLCPCAATLIAAAKSATPSRQSKPRGQPCLPNLPLAR